jgi:SAM-dependent methyltransferase
MKPDDAMKTSDKVAQHYASTDIAGRVIAAVKQALGPDTAITPDTLAAVDHFHGRGLVATREMAALLGPRAGERVLDIGSGIGGPARWLAAHFGCHVTGIDLTQAFCDAAEALNQATGMADKVRIVHGNALALPFADGSFDRAYSQNVVMNIADKQRFYREALRVLRPGGVLALSNATAGAGGAPYYPTPWASEAATSFLASAAETRADLEAVGLAIVSFRDTTADLLAAQISNRDHILREGLPRLGPHVFMGPAFRDYQLNAARSAIEGRLGSLEALVRKPER